MRFDVRLLQRVPYEGISRMQTSLRRYVPLNRTPALHTTDTDTLSMEPGEIIPSSIVLSNEFGHWARVPGLEDELWVSSTGWVWQRNVRTGGWFTPSKNAPHSSTGDVFVNHRGKDLRVHKLMALAFFGPQPTPSHTVDHIAKYDGDIIRERSDNRIENLRWASKREQSLNRNKQKPRRDGRPVLIWKLGSDKATATWYPSSLAGSKALGLNAGAVSHTANGGRSQTNGYCVEFAPTDEPDKIADDEVFRLVDGFKVSQYGRALDPQTEAFSFTPQVNKGQMYAYISKAQEDGSTKSFSFHILVAKAWPELVGVKPEDGTAYTLDHISRQKHDNRACNLRWSTLSGQSTNQTRVKIVQKAATPVELKAPMEDQWQRFDTQCEAVASVNVRYNIKLSQQTVSDSLKMAPSGRTINKGKHKGWSIRMAQ